MKRPLLVVLVACFLLDPWSRVSGSPFDRIVLKNGDAARVVLQGVTDNNVTYRMVAENGAVSDSNRTLPMERVDYIEFGYGEGEQEIYENLSSAPVEALEALWNEQFGNLHRPRSRTARYGLGYAARLLQSENDFEWKKALDICDRVIGRAWSPRDRSSAVRGRIQTLMRLGRLDEARREAEEQAAKTEAAGQLIEVRFLLAEASFRQLRELEEENPRWEEDDLVRPERNQLYHESVDQYLWPFLFHGTEESAAVRGLVSAAEVYVFGGEMERARAALTDAIELYPRIPATDSARERLDTLTEPSNAPSNSDNETETE